MATTRISQGIALAVLTSATTISPLIQIEDIKPTSNGVVSVNYAKVVRPTDILPFRLTITNIGIEGYRENNPPGIGIQVIGFSNYIL
jgi:hypothetical protein